MKSLVRGSAAAVALLVATATAAAAHPALNPNTMPLGEPVETVLVTPHGCTAGDDHGDGEAQPTVEVAIAVTDDVEVEPQEVDGWETTVDDEAVTWTDAGGATAEPIELPVTVTVTGSQPGDRYLDVYQECEGGDAYRWTAEPGEEGDPALELTVVESTAPAETTPPTIPTPEEGSPTPTEAAETMPPSPLATTPTDVPTPGGVVAESEQSGSVLTWIVVLVVIALVAAVIVTAVRGRRGEA